MLISSNGINLSILLLYSVSACFKNPIVVIACVLWFVSGATVFYLLLHQILPFDIYFLNINIFNENK